MRLPFHTLDVFTSQRFAGNPLAVVLDADGLDAAQMQTIAREFNLSETIFVMKSLKPAHTAKVRIFTPGAELPFAGHPTVGVAALLAELRSPQTNGERDALIILEETIGTVRVGVRQRAGEAAFAEFDAPKLPERHGMLPPAEELAAALGLIPNEIGFANHRPIAFTAGVPFSFVPVEDLDAIQRARPRFPYWDSVFTGSVPGGAFLYTRETVHTTSHVHARMFWPATGVNEDPATGSAAAALAGLLHTYDSLPDGVHRYVVEQGFEMGRQSLISLNLTVQRGKLETVRIGGHAVRVSEGTISI